MNTQRTATTLQALFPNNTTRQITPDRVRDLIESNIPSYGAMHFDDPGTLTAIATVSTWTKAANTSTLHNGANRFSQEANNRLRYDGAVGVVAFMTATIAVKSAANNKQFSFALGVNGTIEEASRSTTKVATGGDIQHVTVTLHALLSPNDYIELFVMNETDDTDLTIVHAHITAQAHMI